MDTIKYARELGKAIQQDSRFIAYNETKLRNDNDSELQEKIGAFNLTRQNLQMEMSRPEGEKDENKIAELNTAIQSKYNEIMTNTNMAEFTIAKNAVDKMLNEINQIISLCCDGADPDTCEVQDCGGSCATCGGCG